MSFSPAQQPEFRKLLDAAWGQYCREEAIDPVPKKPDRGWYEREMYFAVAKTSTTECDRGSDYDRVMAHFEELGRGGIKWQMKVHGGDEVRMLHELRKAVGEAALEGIDGDYFRAVARRMITPAGQATDGPLPELKDLPKAVRIAVLGEVKRDLRRKLKREASQAAAVPPEMQPF